MLNQDENNRLEEAHNLYAEGKFDDALIIYQDLAFSAPDDGFIFMDIAKTYMQKSNPKLALSFFNKAIKRLEEAHHYDVRKEFAGMLHAANQNKDTAETYLPVASQAKNEDDLITGIKYCMLNEDIDSCEQLLTKHIQSFPNALDAAVKITDVDNYLIERLKNRKRSILSSLKDEYLPLIDETEGHLTYLKKNAEEGAFDTLIESFEKGMEDFDYAESVVEIVKAKTNLNGVAAKIKEERNGFEANLAKKEMSDLKLQNREKLSTINALEDEIRGFLKILPNTSLKQEDIPAYLNVVKDYKVQIKSPEILTVRRAYQNSDNLIKEGKFFKEEAQRTIERHKEMAAQTALVAAQSKGVAKKSNGKKAKNEDEPVIIIDSQTGRRISNRRKIKPIYILIPLILIGGIVAFYMLGQGKTEKRVLLTNVFLRQYPDGESAKVREDSYKDGEALKVLKEEGEWLKLETSDGNVGYMKGEYFSTPAEYTFIQGIFANDEAREQFHSARHKLTLLYYFKENEWVGDISEQLEKDIYGDYNPSRELRQVVGMPEGSSYNTSVLTDLSPYEKMDLACIVRGKDNEKFIIYSYEDDNTPVKAYETTLEGTGHTLKAILDKNDNNYWFLGTYEYGSKVTEKLNGNAILLSMGDYCSFLYYYKNGYFNEYAQSGCD